MLRKLFALPAVHFAAIGAALFLARGLAEPALPAASSELDSHSILIDAATLADLREGFRRSAGRTATEAEEQVLLRDYADQEILYREARARGLDRGDRSVRWRLVQKMQFLEERSDEDPDELYRKALALGLDRDDIIIRRLLIEKMRLLIQLGAPRDVPEEALQQHFNEIAQEFRQPARVSLVHVFLAKDRHGAAIEEAAAQLRNRLPAQPASAEDAVALGDVFPLGHRLRAHSEASLAKVLGPEFAHTAIALPVGGWHGPIRSAYGLHFVWVESRIDSTLPPLESVRAQVTQRYLAERREEELARVMARLRTRYTVAVDGGAALRK